MVSIAMPGDLEMLVSHNKPVFGHSSSGYSADSYLVGRLYESPRVSCRPQVLTPPLSRRASPPATLSIPQSKKQVISATQTCPKRPCLVIRQEDILSPENATSPSSPRSKKKVVFADDQGLSLTEIRIMSEPSDVPPFLKLAFTNGFSHESDEPWEVNFAQPASDYLGFRRKLDDEKVSLENVIIKEKEECATGTIKVRNIAFNKEVIVRATSDDWKTHEDVFGTYVPAACQSSAAYILYDTFSFKLTLPPKSRKLEFCVAFRCEGQEFWDNNNGSNYKLTKKLSPIQPPQHNSSAAAQDANKSINKFSDATMAKISTWSEFSSWQHLEINGPYW